MRVGLVAPPWIPVPPVKYGGTEQVVNDLALGLTKLGHEVQLFTVKDSHCPVPKRWFYDSGVTPIGASVPEAAHVLDAYELLTDVDVIHDHTIVGPLIAGRMPHLPPVVATNHGPFTREARLIYAEVARTASVVAISHHQRATAPEIPITAVIHHGIDTDIHGYGDGAGGYAMFVGRMSPDKGLHVAIRVARTAGIRLLVVSKMREPAEREYFEHQIKPLLHDEVDLLSELSATERIAVLRSAAVVLNPIDWPEPFGLVMAESLACGTPVLAFPRGAAPEIIEDGKTGFLCEDEAEMVQALSHIDTLDRRQCRAAAEEKFSVARMATDHVSLYERLTSDEHVAAGNR